KRRKASCRGEASSPDGNPSRLSKRQNLVHSSACLGVFVSVAADLGDDIIIVADGANLPHDRRPVHRAIHQLCPCVTPFPVVYLEVLEVNLLDTVAQYPYPLLWIAVENHVSGIKIAADVIAVEAVQEVAELQRTDKQFVPDVFEGDV